MLAKSRRIYLAILIGRGLRLIIVIAINNIIADLDPPNTKTKENIIKESLSCTIVRCFFSPSRIKDKSKIEALILLGL